MPGAAEDEESGEKRGGAGNESRGEQRRGNVFDNERIEENQIRLMKKWDVAVGQEALSCPENGGGDELMFVVAEIEADALAEADERDENEE